MISCNSCHCVNANWSHFHNGNLLAQLANIIYLWMAVFEIDVDFVSGVYFSPPPCMIIATIENVPKQTSHEVLG